MGKKNQNWIFPVKKNCFWEKKTYFWEKKTTFGKKKLHFGKKNPFFWEKKTSPNYFYLIESCVQASNQKDYLVKWDSS